MLEADPSSGAAHACALKRTRRPGPPMHVLMIACHPRADRYSAALRDAAHAALEAAGHEVRLRDLHANGFVPVMSAAEHRVINAAGENEAFIAQEAADLRWAEALVLIYPTWWYGMPAMLKGW